MYETDNVSNIHCDEEVFLFYFLPFNIGSVRRRRLHLEFLLLVA